MPTLAVPLPPVPTAAPTTQPTVIDRPPAPVELQPVDPPTEDLPPADWIADTADHEFGIVAALNGTQFEHDNGREQGIYLYWDDVTRIRVDVQGDPDACHVVFSTTGPIRSPTGDIRLEYTLDGPNSVAISNTCSGTVSAWR